MAPSAVRSLTAIRLDLPAALLALGGSVVVEGRSGRREVNATDFHLELFETALAPDEVLIEVRVPDRRPIDGGLRSHQARSDWAIVGAVATRHDDGVGVGLINMGPVPLRAHDVELRSPRERAPDTPPSWRTRIRTRPLISTHPPSTAATWRACSYAYQKQYTYAKG